MHKHRHLWSLLLTLIVVLTAAGCSEPTPEMINITLTVGGTSQSLAVTQDFTVDDVLRQSEITLGDLDRVNPQRYNRVSEGMTITVVRVTEETEMVQETIPYKQEIVLNDSLPAGEERLIQPGVNGIAEITYRIVYEDDTEISRSEVKRVDLVSPKNEVVMVGSQGQLAAVTVDGTLVYISGGNAWLMRGNSATRRPLTLEGGLDGRVFDLAEDGKRLLFTRSSVSVSTTSTPGSGLATATSQVTPTSSGTLINTLWAILDITDPDSKPVGLSLSNILNAQWVPGSEDTIVYSTAEPRPNFPGWQANNDLWQARIDNRKRVTGHKLLLEPSSGGIYGWFGTTFRYSPDGKIIAWAQPDAVGVLSSGIPDEEGNTPPPNIYQRETMVTFAPRHAYDFVWIPTLAWSPDSTLVATTTHGMPLGDEPAEDSPVFNVTIFPAQGGYSIDVVERAGMWAAPQYSPSTAPDGSELEVRIAYLQAMQPLDQTSRYRLMVMDRDGSNQKALFPPEGQLGLASQSVIWSPTGRQIAMIYQGNLYLVDLSTGRAQQLTLDALSSSPRWAP
ncbi:MAG: G5 domain-containing protein [Anaerolineae bacterium]|nr:G5 domain-containing protein [Anaerolineae bacterium]